MSSEKKSETSKTETKKTDEEVETLYKALKNIGITSVTTLINRLGILREGETAPEKGISTKGETAPEKGKEETYHENAKNLLKLMKLDETRPETVMLLEKIGLQGRDMLGEIPKPTIASAPIGKWRRETKPKQPSKPESGQANE